MLLCVNAGNWHGITGSSWWVYRKAVNCEYHTYDNNNDNTEKVQRWHDLLGSLRLTPII